MTVRYIVIMVIVSFSICAHRSYAGGNDNAALVLLYNLFIIEEESESLFLFQENDSLVCDMHNAAADDLIRHFIWTTQGSVDVPSVQRAVDLIGGAIGPFADLVGDRDGRVSIEDIAEFKKIATTHDPLIYLFCVITTYRSQQ